MLTAIAVTAAVLATLMTSCGAVMAPGAPQAQVVAEGELSFFRPGAAAPIARIQIAIADTPAQRSRGLMYVRRLPPDGGMLFVLDSAGPVTFWMRNTFVPLDIIFVNNAKTVISIAKNTTPLSDALIPSHGDARYVVEVNAGYCEAHGIKQSDTIGFRRTPPTEPVRK